MRLTPMLSSLCSVMVACLFNMNVCAQDNAGSPPVSSAIAFDYTALDTVEQEYRDGSELNLALRSEMLVKPYIYVAGELSSQWVVNGVGSKDVKEEWLHVYHNMDVRLRFAGWNNPTLDGKPDTASVPLKVSLLATSTDGSQIWNGTGGYVDASTANIESSVLSVSLSMGHFSVAVGRHIVITPGTELGTYIGLASLIVTQL